MAKSPDLKDFKEKVLKPYLEGRGENDIAADDLAARSIIPAMTATARSFASVAHDFPEFAASNCIACMECVVACPDAAIRARVTTENDLTAALTKVANDGENRAAKESICARFVKTQKHWTVPEKKGKTPGLFSIWVDPDKCKGCGECAQVCAHDALKMKAKEETSQRYAIAQTTFVEEILPSTPNSFVDERMLVDLFLQDEKWIYHGGAGSCMGCGEITALKMALTVTSAKYGNEMAIVAATGCNSVFSSTYPYNIFNVPWTNPLFENATTTALGVRLRLNQTGKNRTRVWAVGGDGAMGDIGFQALSRTLISGEDIKILVMDTQVYSNTGGQASTSTFMGQNAKMSASGRTTTGKAERRKELGLLALMHPEVYVAQVSPAYYNHFLRAISDALDFPGPAVIIAYSPCMPEHGVADHMSFDQAKAAVIGRAFPIYTYDPRRGNSIRERLDLRGNPSINAPWHVDPKSQETQDFVWFARREGRFDHQFNKEGVPSPDLMKSQEERAKNWRTLQELSGQAV